MPRNRQRIPVECNNGHKPSGEQSGSTSQTMIIGRTATETVTTMKCSFCQGHLSIPPIFIIKKDGSDHKCGRCEQVKSDISIRNVLFETIAKNIEFPCKYAHCEKKNLWNEPTRNHELICPEKAINCPDLYCGQSVKQIEIGQHYRSNHDTAIITGQFHIKHSQDSQTEDEYVRCIFKKSELYLIYLKYSFHNYNSYNSYNRNSSYGNIYLTVLSMIKPDDDTTFTLTLSTSDPSTEKIIIEDQNIEYFDEKMHCSRCVLKPRECTNVCHVQKNNEGEFKAKVVLKNNVLVDHWVNSTKDILLTITLTDPKRNNELSSRFAPCLEHMKCPVCFLYLSVPIHTCNRGHSVCNVCKRELVSCPICKSQFAGSRNFALENVIQNIQVPCCYNDNGCEFIGKPEILREHEKVCSKN